MTKPHILSVATADPEFAVSTDDVKEYFPKAFHSTRAASPAFMR